LASVIRLPLPNVWLGVSCEDQAHADDRIPDLLATPAAVRFVSLEPLLGPIDLIRIKLQGAVDPFDAFVGATWSQPASLNGARFFSSNVERQNRPRLDWVIVSGESGPRARPMKPAWERKIRDDCATAGIPFFKKQWGEWAPDDYCRDDNGNIAYGHWHGDEFVQSCLCSEGNEVLFRFGKRDAGRELDGRTWSEMPEVVG
jgi:protein gp37